MAAVGLGRRADMTNDEEDRALKIAENLIKLGADVNAATETGWTALHAAAFLGSDKLVRFLVEKGAAIDAVNGCGRTPISLALADKTDGMLDRTLPRVDTAELLIELGAGNAPPPAPVGECIGGRGGLEADQTQNEIVTKAIKDIVLKLEERKKKWNTDAALLKS
jgi:ankyrin repeat protein